MTNQSTTQGLQSVAKSPSSSTVSTLLCVTRWGAATFEYTQKCADGNYKCFTYYEGIITVNIT